MVCQTAFLFTALAVGKICEVGCQRPPVLDLERKVERCAKHILLVEVDHCQQHVFRVVLVGHRGFYDLVVVDVGKQGQRVFVFNHTGKADVVAV